MMMRKRACICKVPSKQGPMKGSRLVPNTILPSRYRRRASCCSHIQCKRLLEEEPSNIVGDSHKSSVKHSINGRLNVCFGGLILVWPKYV
jgi:hypothetical protein